jgi:hypothetical protein
MMEEHISRNHRNVSAASQDGARSKAEVDGGAAAASAAATAAAAAATTAATTVRGTDQRIQALLNGRGMAWNMHGFRTAVLGVWGQLTVDGGGWHISERHKIAAGMLVALYITTG